jgi:hypothetical protein
MSGKAWKSISWVLALVALLACNKTTYIGVDVLPGSDDVGAIYTDTFTLLTNTIREDTVLTSSTTNNTAGFIYDPVFGKSYAAFYTQLLLSTNDVDFGDPDTLYIDSVVLTLAYGGYYGYKDVPQTFLVYRLTEDMDPKPENGYYSHNDFDVDPNPLGRKDLFVPNFTDSVSVLDLRLPPHMRIRLSDRFGQELLGQSGGFNFSSDTAFKDYLKGLCVAPDTASTPYSASMLYFNLTSLYSGLQLYWHTPTRDSLSYVFPVGSTEIRSGYFKHNYTGSAVEQHLSASVSDNDSLVFIQGLGGLKTRITIPALDSLKDVVINKAEITLTQKIDPTKTDSIFKTPPQIVCVTADSTGRDLGIPDNQQFFPNPGGVKVSKVTLGRESYAQYTFSVATQLQEIVSGITEDRGLFLIIFKRAESADRIMAGGANRNDNLKMKLDLIYTPIRK